MAELEDGAVELQIEATLARGCPAEPVDEALAGELDSSNVEQLERGGGRGPREHAERVVFDLSALHFMDSAGISVLVPTAAEVEQSSRSVTRRRSSGE